MHKRVILGLALSELALTPIDEFRDEVVTNYACLDIKRKPAAKSQRVLPESVAVSGMLPI